MLNFLTFLLFFLKKKLTPYLDEKQKPESRKEKFSAFFFIGRLVFYYFEEDKLLITSFWCK